MGLIGKILTFPVSGPIDGLMAIVKQIQKRAEEQQEKTSPRAKLAELESKLMTGEISADEYKEQEDELLKQIDEQLNEAQQSNG